MASDETGQVANTSLVLMCRPHAAPAVGTPLLRREVRTRPQAFVLQTIVKTRCDVASTLLASRQRGRCVVDDVGEETDARVVAVNSAEGVVPRRAAALAARGGCCCTLVRRHDR